MNEQTNKQQKYRKKCTDFILNQSIKLCYIDILKLTYYLHLDGDDSVQNATDLKCLFLGRCFYEKSTAFII